MVFEKLFEIIDILENREDSMEKVEVMTVAKRLSDSERKKVRCMRIQSFEKTDFHKKSILTIIQMEIYVIRLVIL
jgi:hypothetical protein